MRDACHQVSPVPDMIHSVEVTFTAVAIPLAVSVREPVVPVPASRMVSLVMAIVIVPAPFWLMNVIAVPTRYGTLALLSIVQVRADVSADG